MPLVSLAVDGRRWSRVADFEKSGPTDRNYVVQVDDNGDAVVTFGNGKRGKIPKPGSKIAATYRFRLGAVGNRRRKKTYLCIRCD